MAKKRRTADGQLTAALRRMIRDSGKSFYIMAKTTGIERMSLTRFASGESSIRLDVADKLADYFGLELVEKG